MECVSTQEDTHVAVQDFVGTELGDPRRSERLVKVADAIARAPGSSLPKIAATSGDLEGMYRFFRNPDVEPEVLVAAHAAATAERCREAVKGSGEVLMVVHDTTDFEFEHLDPDELGYLNTGDAGFFGHFALALQGTELRRPLGVLSLETIRRKKKRRRRKIASGSETAKWKDRESERWKRGVVAARARLGAETAAVHLMDREADSFALLDEMARANERFIVRLRHDRKAKAAAEEASWSRLRTLVSQSADCLEREVPLSARRAKTAPRESRRSPARKTRLAQLRFAATSLTICRPRYMHDGSEQLTVNVVRVYEVDAPSGADPVEWLLVTQEPITTAADVARIVDIYRCRWVIEEFFKALKTGCSYEQRYAGSAHALQNILAICLPIAAHLLWLRSRARTNPDAPATEVVSPRQVEVIRRTFRLPWFPPRPSARDVLLAIAEHGGHIRSNGEPGWLVLHRGLQSLLEYERGWAAAREGLNL